MSSQFYRQGKILESFWGANLVLAGLVITMTVNALATGLIVFRIFVVFREIRVASDDQVSGATHGTKLRSIIFVLIESGLLLLSIQLARLVVTIFLNSGNGVDSDSESAFALIVYIHQQLNVIRL